MTVTRDTKEETIHSSVLFKVCSEKNSDIKLVSFQNIYYTFMTVVLPGWLWAAGALRILWTGNALIIL